ncbi:MAG TPA: trehalose-phosphatase [Candidatus Deferrimicrobiaceae bacterium]
MAGGKALWVFDFDGTLSVIVPDRDAAQLHPMCRELLNMLAATPGYFVAVLSSRSIEDLASRVPLPGVILGGASGLEWRLPGGHRVHPGDVAENRREKAKEAISPQLARLSSFPGVDVEDKGWSVAVHYRHVLPEARAMLEPLLSELGRTPGIRVYRGPSVAEVQLLPHVSKSFGIRRICRFLGVDLSGGRLLYAGDDENDAVAMRWVLRKGGVALVVGNRMRVPGARCVDSPVELVRVVRELAAIVPRRHGGKRGEVVA